MCGIAGVYSYGRGAKPVDREELLRVRDAMVPRGPDGAGLWISADGHVGLAHRRLAIIDVSDAGAQPMSSPDGRLHVTFNGEIYNYRELKRELESEGIQFRSNSDTEVLLHLYAERGERMVDDLRGMYAFAIWDRQADTLFLARDPFGIKPLYYADDGKSVRFASQVKALAKGGRVDLAPEPAGSVGFLVWGYVPEPYTLYRGIRSLPAGTTLLVDRSGSTRFKRFFDIREEFQRAEEADLSADASSHEVLRQAAVDTVRCHMVADVPVGLFLSAGIDSSTLAGLAAERGGTTLNAVTLGFSEFHNTENDEVPVAAAVAKACGLRHIVSRITSADFQAERERIIDAMDQPSIDGVNTYFVSRAAAAAGMKVALSGVGGDELFGGYPSFGQLPRAASLFGFARTVPRTGRVLRRLLAPIVGAVTSTKYASLLEYGGSYGGAYLLRRALFLPWETRSVLDRTTVDAGLQELGIVGALEDTVAGLRQPRSRIAALELTWYMRNQLLRDADWAGMAHSLEIRLPLVDVQFFRAVAPLIISQRYPTKTDFASVLAEPLRAVRNRTKSGFETPIRQWLPASADAAPARGLRDWAKQVLPVQPRMMRALVLVTDAFGGRGGIAKFNRDLLTSVAAMREFAEVVVTPRVIGGEIESIPPRIRFITTVVDSKLRFIRAALMEVLRSRVDFLIVGHINLAPLGALLATISRVPSVLVIYGIDAWSPHKSPFVKRSLRCFTHIAGISQTTLSRFAQWSGVDESRLRLLPPCVDLSEYGPGPRPAELADRLGLTDRTVLMTLGRLESEERAKGFDEIIDVLPQLKRQVPNISYLVCGTGNDRARLERKVQSMGLSDRVVFTGFAQEKEKANHYRLADAYVMPSRGEGFGIVFLEALACGVPVLASGTDGGREALLNGDLGCLVDPSDPDDLVRGILETLTRPKGKVPEALTFYSRETFSRRAEALVREALATR